MGALKRSHSNLMQSNAALGAMTIDINNKIINLENDTLFHTPLNHATV